MPKQQKQRWRVGDMFLVENKDHQYTVGQIVGQERGVLNSMSCAFFDLRVSDESELASIELSQEKLIAVLFVTRDLLDQAMWRVVGHRPVSVRMDQLPYEHLKAQGFVGAKVIGSANVREFLDAFQGLVPWDDWKDPNYLDRLLISPDKKPAKLVFKKVVPFKPQ